MSRVPTDYTESKPLDSPAKEHRTLIFYAGVIIIPLILFLLSGEITMRFLITPQMIPAPPPPADIDPYLINPYIVQARPYFYFHIPKAEYTQARAGYRVKYTINTRGFRGPEIAVPKAEGIKRLVVIGDSIVEGHGNAFNKTFSYLLNEQLSKAGREVVNAGVQGASPIYYAANAERYLSLQPDAVLIMLYENDIQEDRQREAAYFQLPHIDNVKSILNPSSAGPPPLSYFSLALTRLHQNFFLTPLERIIAGNRKYVEMNTKYQPVPGHNPFIVSPSLIDGHWSMSQAYLDWLLSFFQKHAVQVLITNLNIYSLQPNSGPASAAYAGDIDERVSAWAREKKLPFFSLLPVIRQSFREKNTAEVIIQGDGHPTNETHARIEAALRPWLLQNLN